MALCTPVGVTPIGIHYNYLTNTLTISPHLQKNICTPVGVTPGGVQTFLADFSCHGNKNLQKSDNNLCITTISVRFMKIFVRYAC